MNSLLQGLHYCPTSNTDELQTCQQLMTSTTNTHHWYTIPKRRNICFRPDWCFRQWYRRRRVKEKTCAKSTSFVTTVWGTSSFVLFASGFYGNQELFKISGKWCYKNGISAIIKTENCPCRHGGE